MRPIRRLPLPLLLAGVGLVVAALHTGPAPAPAQVTAAVSAYVPPAPASPPAVHQRVRVAPRHPRAVHPSAPAASPTTHTGHRPAPQPAAAHASIARAPVAHKAVAHRTAAAKVSGPTSWSALNAAIARIPTYHPGAARWVVSSKYDFWGTADWYHDVLYVDPGVPVDKLYDVAVHEWSHELSVLDYHGDVAAATKAMNSTFGGRGLTGPERAADCMAVLQGADWTHYTTCTNPAWRAAAARLVAGKQLR